MQLTIGLLLPRSDMYPRLAMDFLNGFKHTFQKFEERVESPKLIIESTGTASDANLVKLAEKMILQENVDITISFCGTNLLEEFVAVFNNYKKPLIHVDLGGAFLKKSYKNPYVLHHTLMLCQSSYLAGKHAANSFGKKGYAIASAYDGGYHLSESFTRGFTSEGGVMDKFYVGPMDYKSESFETITKDIEEIKPDVVFAAFSYKEGQKIYSVLANSEMNGQVPIVCIPTMTDETISTENYQVKNIHSMATWSFDNQTPEMEDFRSMYKTTYDENPNIMALLGYEVGLTLAACITSEGKLEKKLEEAVAGKIIETPRGKLHYNKMNEAQVETMKWRAFEYNKEEYHNSVTETFDASFVTELYEEFEALGNVAWHNPYIIT